jgi:putative endonuclease
MARYDGIAVYIMASRRYGVLYIGVTSELLARVAQHRAGEGGAFAAKYKCTRLVWYEPHAEMATAIQRETSLKRWPRQWKINLIEAMNPGWIDLWDQLQPRPLPGRWLSVEEIRRGKRLEPEE